MSTNEFPLNPAPGALAELDKADGSTVIYKWDDVDAAWKIVGVNGGTQEYITTLDVQTTVDEPAKPTGFNGISTMDDLGCLTNQKLVNWYFADEILTNKEDLQKIIWIGENPPGENDGDYIFWWHSLDLELLTQHNGQWFPVSIPPAQAETLRQEIDALFQDTTTNRLTIATTQQELDTRVFELNEQREQLKQEYDGKLATLEEELEQLAPSLERGSWTFTMNANPGPGEYTMIKAFLDEDAQEALCNQTLADCQAAAAGDPVAGAACTREYDACMTAIDGSRIVTTDDWTECDELVFNNVDMNGLDHGWGGIDSDHYIDLFNMNDENFMIGDIATHGGGTFSFDLVSSKGVASGPATVKIFKSEGTVDFDQYVRKQGSTMNGELQIIRDDTTDCLYLKGTGTGTVMYVHDQNSRTSFRVKGDGHVQAGTDASRPFLATEDNDITTKKYVDKKAYGYPFKWVPWEDYDTTVVNLVRGTFTYDKDGGWAYIADFDKDNINHFTNAQRDSGMHGMLKAYASSGTLKTVLKFKDVRLAHETLDNGVHVARYNIESSFRTRDLTEDMTYYLKDGAWLL